MAGASRQFYHQAGLGSVIATTDSSGAVPATQRFDAWGNVAATSGTSISQHGYTGREPDATGLMYYRARYYSPDLRRFTQRDPIGLAGGINDYSYVGGNPVNFTDPMGLLESCAPAFAAYAGVVGGVIAGGGAAVLDVLSYGAKVPLNLPEISLGVAAGTTLGYAAGKLVDWLRSPI